MSSNNQNQDQQPGLVASHAQYVKAAAVETIGNLTNAETWKSSGAEQKDEAVHAMREAGEKRDPKEQGYGKMEQTAGKVVGCEGMKREGDQSL